MIDRSYKFVIRLTKFGWKLDWVRVGSNHLDHVTFLRLTLTQVTSINIIKSIYITRLINRLYFSFDA